MIYEYRTYQLHPGRLAAFLERFEKVSVPLFKERGIKLIAFWQIGKFKESKPQVCDGGVFLPAMGSAFGQDQIAYLVAFDTIEQRDAAWRAWVQNPQWIEAKRRSEADGPIVADETCVLLSPAAFSPL